MLRYLIERHVDLIGLSAQNAARSIDISAARILGLKSPPVRDLYERDHCQSLRRSLMEPRLRTSRSPASPRPCPIPGVSRSGASDCDVSPATHARRHRSRRRNRLKQTPNQRQPSRSRNASYVGQRAYRSCGLRAGVHLNSPRVPCEPVSVCNRTGLRPAEREIEKWRPETGAQNPPRTDRNMDNYRPETGIRQRNPRECQQFSPTGK